MSLKPLNSVGGFSVGETPANIILSNRDITGTNANFTGNVTAPYFIGNVIGNISGNLSVSGPNTGVVFNDGGGANSTSTFTFDKLTGIVTVTGNTVSGNFLTAGTVIASTLQSNIATGTAPLTVASTTLVSNLNADLLDGYNTAIGNTASTVAVRDTSGNISANFFIGNGSQLTGLITNSISNGTSNVTIPVVNGNVNISSAGNANILVVTGTGANITGTLNATGNANAGNIGATTGVFTNISGTLTTASQTNITAVGTLGSLSVTGNTTSGNFLTAGTVIASTLQSNVATGTAPIVVASTTLVSNLNADLLDGYNTAISNTASTVAVRDTSGNISANYFIGNGSQLTGLITNGISNGTSNVSIPASGGNVNTSVGGTANVLVVTTTGANITGTLNATGNANAGNIGATTGVFTNISGTLTTASQTNITAVGTLGSLSVTGNANVGNIGATNGVLTGTLSVTGNANVGNLGTSGNITAGYYFGNGSQLIGVSATTASSLANGTSNVTIPAVNGNVNISSAGNANILVVTGTGVNVSGTLNSTGNATASNLLTSGTVIASTLQSNVATGTAPLVVASTTLVANLNADFLDGYNTATANTGTTVAVRDSSGNLSANYFIGNGSQLTGLITNSISNGTSNVSIPVSGGNVNTSVGGTANVLVVTTTGANITGTLNASGNANVGNVGATTGVFTNISGTLTTASQTNITAVGTLGSLSVTGNVTAGNFIGVFANGTSNVAIPAAAGNINLSVGGTSNVLVVTTTGINVAGTLNSSGNANVGNLGTTGLITASGNVTGGNLVTTGLASISGNATVGNLITAGIVQATGNVVSSASVVTNSVVGRTSGITLQATGTNQDIELRPTGSGTVDVGNTRVSNVAEPTQANDAATKNYVDAAVQSLHVHDSCYVATTTTLATATGGTTSYNEPNGSGNAIGSYIATTGTFSTIDTSNVQTVGTRILVKNEANAAWNGIYSYTNTTAVTRTADFDTSLEAAGGDFVFITSGNINADTGWVQTTDNPTLGSSNIVWVQFSGAGSYTAGTGLQLIGSQFSIANTAVSPGTYGNGDRVSTFTVNQQGQLTAASNTAITANAANLTGTTLAATIVNSSLTSVGTLTSLNVTGNANVGNIGATTGVFTNISGTLTTASQTNITSVGTLGSLSVTGNVTAGNLLGVFANGNSNVSIPAINGNVTISAVGNANIVTITGTGVNVAGTLNTGSGNANVGNIGATTGVFTNVTGTLTTAAQPNITSVGTLTSLTSSGNIVGGNVTANTASFIGNTAIRWANVTTSAITANQTVSTVAVSGITGVEWFIKGTDSAGSKYSVATVQAVTDGSAVDYSIYGTVNIGSATGTLAVNIVGSNIALQVTPASTNSTVWTTQYRTI